MTFATSGRLATAPNKSNAIMNFGATLLARIKASRANRNVLKGGYHYEREKTANLAQAQRDVNRVWQGSTF